MPLFMTSEVFVRIKAKDADGNEHVREFGINPEDNFNQIFLDAHMNEDGSCPTPAQLGFDAKRWALATRLREIMDELRTLCGGSNF